MTRYTAATLNGLDSAVQMTQDQRLLAHLTVSGASVPDASPEPLHPGVPEGATFLPVAPRFDVAEVVLRSETPHQRIYREAGL